MEEIAAIKAVPLFASMSDSDLGEVRRLMAERSFVPGQVIFRQGEPGDSFHVIQHGTVQFLTEDGDGNQIELGEATEGGWFGELSMLTGRGRAVRVQAVDSVQTLVLGRDDFLNFLKSRPQASLEVLTVLAQRLAQTDEMLRRVTSKNVNELEEEKLTLGQHVADGFAAMMGSWPFIIIQSIILAAWVVLNVIAWIRHWDPYPFILLNLALSFQAAYAAPIIMMSQNRSADKDRLAADIDHQVNIKAEAHTLLILKRLDDLERGVHHLHEHQHGMATQPKEVQRTPS
ncbi:MAG TPA: DUF1003 domain-containing protein [Tepidisphaeraceae bacterium]|nr:DUF1003 domain-containing protein [Tepidisphaeraceae bacterium]